MSASERMRSASPSRALGFEGRADVEAEGSELGSKGEERLHSGEDASASPFLAGERIREGLEVAEGHGAERLGDECAKAPDVGAVGAEGMGAGGDRRGGSTLAGWRGVPTRVGSGEALLLLGPPPHRRVGRVDHS